MILGDLGAEVVKIEPTDGDNARHLLGSGAGFFPMFNRNKKSLSLDIKDPRGREILLKLIAGADVFIENFKSGVMDKLGLNYAALACLNPRLIYVSLKGFLPGPYEHRTALDEVVQMMGGLAYMTGPPGLPLRAGTSVNDIMGGMFGAIGVLSALHQRNQTGLGQEVLASLFENNVFLVGQHMMQFAVTGVAAGPMPDRISAWAVYDVFTAAEGQQIFLAVVSDTQWALFCDAFGLMDLKHDTRLTTNNDRVRARKWMMPLLRARLALIPVDDISAKFEANGLPFARITRPHDLFEDPHLLATGGLAPTFLPNGEQTLTPLLPLTLDGERLPIRRDPPRLGQHNLELLASLGYSDDQIEALQQAGILGHHCEVQETIVD
jgi:crotonobetainyl-CoA:carnitine CoA-transferase CaiB-like acyl-CoA transferase